ncbi:MAG TPA: hypothetical protein VG733_03545 [Chthoniobacteraceae bacterium]|nr:hypothetical protein [Chthoniobacteraceae bacterium]
MPVIAYLNGWLVAALMLAMVGLMVGAGVALGMVLRKKLRKLEKQGPTEIRLATNLRWRIAGIASFIAGLGFIVAFVIDPLQKAQEHAAYVTYYLKAIVMIPPLLVVGGFCAILGEKASRFIIKGRLAGIGVALFILSLCAGMLLYWWLMDRLEAYGYASTTGKHTLLIAVLAGLIFAAVSGFMNARVAKRLAGEHGRQAIPPETRPAQQVVQAVAPPAEPADIKFHCPKCSQKLAVEPSFAGATVTCPQCAQPLIVPTA